MFSKLLGFRPRSGSATESIGKEAAIDAVLKAEIAKREATRAALAPSLKKKADAEAKKNALLEQLAAAEQDDNEEVHTFLSNFFVECFTI